MEELEHFLRKAAQCWLSSGLFVLPTYQLPIYSLLDWNKRLDSIQRNFLWEVNKHRMDQDIYYKRTIEFGIKDLRDSFTVVLEKWWQKF